MKKMLFLGTLFIALLFTGCGNDSEVLKGIGDIEEPTPTPTIIVKRLICEQKVQTVDVDMIADFKGEELTYLGLKYEMNLSAYTDIQINAIKSQDMCSVVKQSMSGYTNAFTNCQQTVENKKLLITADFDLDKLIGSELSKKTSIEEAKTELEKQKYSCTITDKEI